MTDHGTLITPAGVRLYALRLERRSRHPLADLVAICELIHLYRKERPQLVHRVAMKPILYGETAEPCSVWCC